MIAKDSLGSVRMNPEFLEELTDQVGGFGPEGTDSFFAALTPKQDTGRWQQTQVASLETDDFADAGSGVEQQAQ